MAKVLAALGVLGFLGYSCVSTLPSYSPPGRLVGRLHRGMTLREVRAAAEDLGFAWRVDERRLAAPESKDSGHIICHRSVSLKIEAKPADAASFHGYVCENFGDSKSFGMYWSSYACNLVIKDGRVEELWFYMD